MGDPLQLSAMGVQTPQFTRSRFTTSAPLNPNGTKHDIIVIGASAGGIPALQRLFSVLPSDLPATVGVVLHRGTRASELASVLARRSALPIIEPYKDELLREGTIYLAPADQHMVFHQRDVTLEHGPKEHHTRPAIDPLFRSAAAAYGVRVVGVLLSGCGQDGVEGMIAVEDSGGICLTQDPKEAEMPSMPLNAIRYDHVSGVYIIDDLAKALEALAKGQRVSGPSLANPGRHTSVVP